MRSVAPATSLVDLHFQGRAEYIACYVLETAHGIALVDPGPTSTLGNLEDGLRIAGLSLANVTDVILTHIHLDHAGATGSIVRANPSIKVHVHERGARHMANPERLLASATRLYGERMNTLWGEVAPVPRANLRALAGGETLTVGARSLQVAYTPGHATHHVSYFEAATGIAWVGDTLGIRIDNRPYVLPVAPPPDIDLAAWNESHARLRAWDPGLLCPTHFGPARPAAAHIDEHATRLTEWAERVEADLAAEIEPVNAAARFAAQVGAAIRAALAEDDALAYLSGGGVQDSWQGLARSLRKHPETETHRGTRT